MRDLGAAPPFLYLPYPTPVHSTTPAINRPLWGEKKSSLLPFYAPHTYECTNKPLWGVGGGRSTPSIILTQDENSILQNPSPSLQQTVLPPHHRTTTQPVPYQQLNLLCLPSRLAKV